MSEPLEPLEPGAIEVGKSYLFQFIHQHGHGGDAGCGCQDIMAAEVLAIALPFVVLNGPWRNTPINLTGANVYSVGPEFFELVNPKKRRRGPRLVRSTKAKPKKKVVKEDAGKTGS